MARIRSIKPEFFRHEGLYDLEVETGLPIRVAFAGLWTSSDREGRFEWKPRELKLDCLPHDPVDFARVLDALRTRGHIEQFEVDGRLYGFIPSWHEHQVINNRETASVLPEPTESSIATATCTREARVGHASSTPLVQAHGEGKGREGTGKGREGTSPPASQPARRRAPKAETPTNATWDAYATAYEARYEVAPARSAAVNGQLARFVSLIPSAEAPDIAAFYVHHDNGLYVNARHPVNLLLRDAQSLRTQMLSGRKVGAPAPTRNGTHVDVEARNAELARRFGVDDPKPAGYQEVIDA